MLIVTICYAYTLYTIVLKFQACKNKQEKFIVRVESFVGPYHLCAEYEN